jgi:peptide/nickel transport system permease protein
MSASLVVRRAGRTRPGHVLGRLRGAFGVPSLRAGALLLGCLLLASVIVPLALPDPNHQDLATSLSPPLTGGHPLGSDQVGRDVLAWIASGIRTSVFVSLSVVLIAAVVGVTVGLVAGYKGGAVDNVLMRLVDLQLAVPPLLFFITAAAVLNASIGMLILLISVVSWVPYARLVRAHVLAERERAFVAAARLAGTRTAGIVLKHLLPSVTTVVVVLGSLQAGYVLLAEGGLSFLGFGIQPPATSLGYLIFQGKEVLATAWWVTAMPGLALVLLAIAFNTLGDGLREYFKLDVEEVRAR